MKYLFTALLVLVLMWLFAYHKPEPEVPTMEYGSAQNPETVPVTDSGFMVF